MFLLLLSIFILSCGDKSQKTVDKTSISEVKKTTSTFEWSTELCENTGIYDSKKYTANQLQNTYDLWFRYSGINLNTQTNPYKIEDIDKLSIPKLMLEYTTKKALYNKEIVANSFWNSVKTEKLQELEEEYELRKITIEAYNNPTVLLHTKYSETCSVYVEALTSNDTTALLKSWQNLIEEQKRNNGAPEKLMNQYNEKYNSPDRLLYARMDLMTYGWWNCANAQTKKLSDDGTMEKEFNKLFIRFKTDCIEP